GQVTWRGTPFDTLHLDNYVTDVENTAKQMTWTVSPADPQYFNVVINSNREVIVTPKDTTWSGSESLQFTVTDRGKVLLALKKSASKNVVFTIEWMPQITGQVNLSTPEETGLTLTTDDLVYVEPEKAPPGLVLQVQNGDNYTVNGTTITPATDFNGDLTVPVQLSVDGKVSNTYNLQVKVTAVNDPPVFVSQSVIETDRNTAVKVSLEDVTFTDPDNAPDEHTLTLLIGENYTVKADSVIPDMNFYGQLSVNADLSDLQVSTSITLNVTVNYKNIPPEFISEPETSATEDMLYTYVVKASDIDVEDPNVDQTLTYFADSIPSWLSFNTGNDILVGEPSNEDVGDYYVKIGVTDGIDSIYQSFNLSVINVNDPPVISGQKDTITGIVNSYVVLNTNELIIEDPDNAPEDMSLVILAGTNYTFDGDTVFSARDFNGILNVDLKVNDGIDDSNVFTVKVTIDFGEGILVPSQDIIAGVYPNPATEQVNFELKNDTPCYLEIRDVTGKSVYYRRVTQTGGRVTINVSDFARGIYIFRIYNDKKFQTGKLIID
ncbi:MAG TPA: T9SS type A sorting domain-containing protein, partial [Bacteroidales bacterium]|nr:T9SS type A sorting domain-containing protein [Bacteroidales bacterium]